MHFIERPTLDILTYLDILLCLIQKSFVIGRYVLLTQYTDTNRKRRTWKPMYEKNNFKRN